MDSDEGSSDDSSDEDELSEEFEDSSDEDDQWLETVTKSDGTVIPYPQWQVTAPGDSPRGVGGVLHTPLGVVSDRQTLGRSLLTVSQQNIKRHSQNYRVLTKQKDVIHPHIPMGTAEQPVGANHLKSPLHVLLRQRYLRGFNGDTLQAYNLRRGWDSLITPFKFWIEEISHREWDSIMRRRAAKKLEFERKKQEKKEAKEEEE
jgi:hypothetical protein